MHPHTPCAGTLPSVSPRLCGEKIRGFPQLKLYRKTSREDFIRMLSPPTFEVNRPINGGLACPVSSRISEQTLLIEISSKSIHRYVLESMPGDRRSESFLDVSRANGGRT
jgi:hypothetical protein